jgi:hypothetical protein
MNRTNSIKALLWICIVLFSNGLLAQSSFSATTNARDVVENSSFQVSFTIENAEAEDFQAPPFKNFRVINGPNRALSTTINNGKVKSKKTFSYSLMPKGKGRFTIAGATATINGKKMTTNSLVINVVEGNVGSEEDDEGQVFVRVIPTVTDAVVGQQILIDYKLYTTVNVDSYNVLEEADYAGFYAEDIKRFDSRVIQEVEDGVQYTTKVLKRVALFPQQTGTLTIESMLIQMGVMDGNSPSRRSLFFNRNIKRIAIETEPLEINVSSLPSGAPDLFSGAVGTYRVNSSISRNSLTTDDVLSVKIVVQGDGDVKRIQAPTLDLPEGFDVYDPKVKEESTYEINSEIIGKKEFEYLILPKKAGVYNINPSFAYYDPDSTKYVIPNSRAYRVSVRQGSMVAADRDEIIKDDQVNDDIEFIKLDTKLDQKASNSFVGSIIFWVLYILPFLFLGGLFLMKRAKDADLAMDPVLKRQKKAQKEAQKRLETANQHLQANNSRAFYDEVSKAMLGYVCDKLRIPKSELTKDNVKGKLESMSVEEEDINRYMKIIHNCEMALFAGMDNASAMKETYDNCLEVLAKIEVSS